MAKYTGSIEDISASNTSDLQCLSADVVNLPDDVPAGSICQVLDTKKVMQFHAQTKTWYEL